MKFTLGAHDLTLSTEEPRMECKAQKLFPHPDYNNTFHDIMLVKIRCTVKNILFFDFFIFRGMTATLGEHDIQTAEGVEKSCRISKLIAHPEYNEQTKNDIMLGKLKCNV